MPRATPLGPLSPRDFRRDFGEFWRTLATSQLRGVYLDAVSQMDEDLALHTPVDTSYLVNTRTMAVEGEAPAVTIPKRDPHAAGQGAWRTGQPSQPKGPPAYEAGFGADVAGASALARAVGELKPVTVGYLANYAEYVEDRVHMLLGAVGKWTMFCQQAVANAGDVGMGRLRYRPGPRRRR